MRHKLPERSRNGLKNADMELKNIWLVGNLIVEVNGDTVIDVLKVKEKFNSKSNYHTSKHPSVTFTVEDLQQPTSYFYLYLESECLKYEIDFSSLLTQLIIQGFTLNDLMEV